MSKQTSSNYFIQAKNTPNMGPDITGELGYYCSNCEPNYRIERLKVFEELASEEGDVYCGVCGTKQIFGIRIRRVSL